MIDQHLPPPPRHGRPHGWPLRDIVNAVICALRGDPRGHDAGKKSNGRVRPASRHHRQVGGGPQEFHAPRADTPQQMRREGMTVIAKAPGVCGGAASIGDSRIPVWIIVLMSEAGAGLGEMLTAFPQLTPADCAAALNYALMHRAEIDADIAWNKGNV